MKYVCKAIKKVNRGGRGSVNNHEITLPDIEFTADATYIAWAKIQALLLSEHANYDHPFVEITFDYEVFIDNRLIFEYSVSTDVVVLRTGGKHFESTPPRKTKLNRLARIEAYVKDKTRLFSNASTERTKAFAEMLKSIQDILDDKI